MRRNNRKLAAIAAAALTASAIISTTSIALLEEQFNATAEHIDEARVSWLEPSESSEATPGAGLGRYDDLVVFEEEPEEEPAEPEIQSLGTFKLTAYCDCEICCDQWADGVTYTGTEATPERTIAVDPSVIPLGSTIYINGQPYIAEDIGGAIKGNRIDIFFPSHNEALQFGVQYAEVIMHQNNIGGNI